MNSYHRKAKMEQRIELYIDCNNERGDPKSWVNSIVLADGDRYPIIQLESSLGASFRYQQHNEAIRIGGIILTYRDRLTNVGNVFWDKLILYPTEASRLLNCLQIQNEHGQDWSILEAEEDFWSRWKRKDFNDTTAHQWFFA